MSSLPNDVLYDIFLRITVDAQSRSRRRGGVMIEPLFASHVCRRWRQVALSHGTLWSYLCIYNFVGPGPSRRKLLDMFHTWLERSDKAPLNFSIRCKIEGRGDIEGRRQMERVVKSLIAEQQRWRDVHFVWRFMVFSSELRSMKLKNMPILSSINIGIDIQTCDGARIIPLIDIARSQHLECMRLCDRHTIEVGQDPIHSLRQAYYGVVDDPWTGVELAEHSLDMLKACPNLVEFQASLDMGLSTYRRTQDQEFSGRYTCFMHHKLRTLRLWDMESDFPAIVVDKLTLPELRYLEFYTDPTMFVPHHTRVLMEFFERSRSRLEKLELNLRNVSPSDLIPILRVLPSLQELIIYRCRDADLLFKRLTWSGDEPITCPVLRYIRLRAWDFEYGDDLQPNLDTLYLMAKSRGDGRTEFGTATFNNRLEVPISCISQEYSRIISILIFGIDIVKELYVDLKGE